VAHGRDRFRRDPGIGWRWGDADPNRAAYGAGPAITFSGEPDPGSGGGYGTGGRGGMISSRAAREAGR